jgi:hypothetical protein
MKKVDLVIGMRQYPVADLRNHGHWLPGDRRLLQDNIFFRCCSTFFDRSYIVAEHVILPRLFSEIDEQQIPMHTLCRNDPGKVYAG